MAAAQWLWNAALNANPIGLAIIAVTALIAAVGLLTKKFTIITDVVKKVGGFFSNLIGWFRGSKTEAEELSPVLQTMANDFG
ncbi:MAG: hypothetical protein R3190_15685, partial [Thermoanaerobaculia bacterium]|nr:hypothetical protein [Thermoanaerobaculia bacterium]